VASKRAPLLPHFLLVRTGLYPLLHSFSTSKTQQEFNVFFYYVRICQNWLSYILVTIQRRVPAAVVKGNVTVAESKWLLVLVTLKKL
jgi:hypothetical protein